MSRSFFFYFFFFNDTATTEIYTLSLHDALPISRPFVCDGSPLKCKIFIVGTNSARLVEHPFFDFWDPLYGFRDRKSTRLNSSHSQISYAVFCLKKKKKKKCIVFNHSEWFWWSLA